MTREFMVKETLTLVAGTTADSTTVTGDFLPSHVGMDVYGAGIPDVNEGTSTTVVVSVVEGVSAELSRAATATGSPTLTLVRNSFNDGGVAGASRWLGPCKLNAFMGQHFSTGGGDVDGGTFTLTLDGHTTSAIAWDASQSAFLAAITALPNVGVGNVAMLVGSVWTDANSDTYVQFRDLTATELMTIDATGLTGPSAPYLGFTVSGANNWPVEMFTPAVGDIVEDFLHAVAVGFDAPSEPRLFYTDSPTDPLTSPPAWAMPTAGQGIDGLDISVLETDFTNFRGNASGANPEDAQSRPTALSALVAEWAVQAAGTNTNLYQNLPAVVRNAVPVYSYVRDVDSAPTQGEVWIWVKVATPAEMS